MPALNRESLALISMDIDDFKKINDSGAMQWAIDCWPAWAG
jgi:GGDEF domain-containing protein